MAPQHGAAAILPDDKLCHNLGNHDATGTTVQIFATTYAVQRCKGKPVHCNALTCCRRRWSACPASCCISRFQHLVIRSSRALQPASLFLSAAGCNDVLMFCDQPELTPAAEVKHCLLSHACSNSGQACTVVFEVQGCYAYKLLVWGCRPLASVHGWKIGGRSASASIKMQWSLGCQSC